VANIKKNLFGLWRGIAYSEDARSKLYQIWAKDTEVQDLKLNKDDYTGMAMTLALYEHPKTDEILESAKKALTNPDQIKRFEFLTPALSADASVRAEFFESFEDAKNREKEAWVLAACGYIHHPLHQSTSIKQLPLALELLKEIQKTGDIFFPKRWLSATVGQYQSQEAYKLTEEYMADHPNLNNSLKGKLLQATDDLYRYVKK